MFVDTPDQAVEFTAVPFNDGTCEIKVTRSSNGSHIGQLLGDANLLSDRIYLMGRGKTTRWRFINVATKRHKNFQTALPMVTLVKQSQDVNYFDVKVTLTNPKAGETVKNWELSLFLPKGLKATSTYASDNNLKPDMTATVDQRGCKVRVTPTDQAAAKDLQPGGMFDFHLTGEGENPSGNIADLAIIPDDCRLNGILVNY